MTFDSASQPRLIYVRLLHEGVDAYRPVAVEWIRRDVARLTPPSDYDPRAETWEFAPGTIVRVDRRERGDGPV